MAAVLTCGPRAVLGYDSAAALWGFGKERRGTIEVSIAASSARRRDGLLVYRRPNLRPEDVALWERIPVTSIVRTLVDLAGRLDRPDVERMVNEADRLGLVSTETLAGALSAYPGKRGIGRLREMLADRTFRLTDSELERRFLRLVPTIGLPVPETGRWLHGFKVDFYWPDLGLVVETDGLRYHRTPAQQARDRRRDQTHAAAGLASLRFTHAQVRFEPDWVLETLLAVASRLASESALEQQIDRI
jgi:very-short-patch-repair endonuclease